MLSSKDVLERTGISRATLNNYIAAGLVPRPDVLPPDPGDAAAARLGYFPDDTVERIATIQRLKQEGWSLARIHDWLARPAAAQPLPAQPTRLATDAAPSAAPALRQAPVQLEEPRALVVAVLAVGLHDADSLWVAIPVQAYFKLVTDIEVEVRARVREAGGQTIRLAPDRFLCHFLPAANDGHLVAAVQSALDIRDGISALGHAWEARLGAGLKLQPVCGLAAGEAWTAPSPAGDHHVMGDANAQALHLARCAAAGAILITRDLAGRLPRPQRDRMLIAAPGQAARRGGAPFQRLGAIHRGHSPLPRALRDLPTAELAGFMTEVSP